MSQAEVKNPQKSSLLFRQAALEKQKRDEALKIRIKQNEEREASGKSR